MIIQTINTQNGIETKRVPENDQEYREMLRSDLVAVVREAKMAFGESATARMLSDALDEKHENEQI